MILRVLGAVAITAIAGLWSLIAWSGLAAGLSAAPFAADLPFNQATAARKLVLSAATPLTLEQRADLARAALRHAPLSAQSLTLLALLAEKDGDEGKTQRLIDQVKRLGGHDEAVQRILYNWAASGDYHAEALRHAEAMLRQGLASDDLAADFARRSANPAFRSAMVAMLSGKGMWADRWTAGDAARLDDASLDALFASPHFRQTRSAQSLNVLAAELVRSGRARSAWRLAHGSDASRPISLDWQAEALFPASDIFAWNLPAAYGVAQDSGQRQQLVRRDAIGGEPAKLRLGLEPGQYRLAFPGLAPAGNSHWRVMISCEGGAVVAAAEASAAVDFTVDPACGQQAISITAEIGVSAGLPAPVLQRLGI